MMKILDEEKAKALLLGRRSSNPAPAAPPLPPQPTVKSNPIPRKGIKSPVPTPPPPPPVSKITKSQNIALEQLLNESTEVVNVDSIDLNNLDITNVDINFEEIEDFQLVKEALLQGVDLRQYSLQIESNLSQVDKESVADYFAERENFVKLYFQLGEVDGVLGKFEELLSNFQRDLRSISSEIRNLQTQTMSMNMKLRNRKNVEDKVAKFVEDISITQDLRDHISKDEINENFLKYLIFLDKKISLASSYKNSGAIAIADAEPHHQKLLSKAVNKVQKYLNSNVTSFRSFSERKAKQKELAPLGYLFQFLFKHAPQSANDLVASYVDSCMSFYTNFYRNYVSAFERTKDNELATKTEHLTSSSNKLKNVTNLLNKVVHIGNTSHSKNKEVTFFSLGGRSDVLSQLDQPPPEPPAHTNLLTNLAHSASVSALGHSPVNAGFLAPPSQSTLSHSPSLSHSGSTSSLSSVNPGVGSQEPTGASNPGAPSTRHPYEIIFRNILIQLMDMVTSEHMFVVDFFLAGDDVSLAIFGRSIHTFTESLQHYLHDTADLVGMLLVLCILHRYSKVMTERRVGVLDPLFQKLANGVQANIIRVLNENCENIKAATIKELKPIEVAPHIISRRFADLLAAVAVLLPQLPDESKNAIGATFKNLRVETDKLIHKMADEFEKKDKTAFLIANYGLILTIVQDRNIPPNDPVVGPSRKIFDRYSTQFTEEQLGGYRYFVSLINFVKEWGPLVDGGVKIDEASNPKFNKDVVETLLREFDTNWKLGMEEVKKKVKQYFAMSPVAAAQMLELVLEFLHSHYKQLINIVNTCFKQLRTSNYYRPEQVMNDMRAFASI